MGLLQRSSRGVSASAGAGDTEGGSGGGGGTTLFNISHQSTTSGGSTYPVYYGTNLGSSIAMGVMSGSMGADNGTNTWNWSHQTVGGYSSRNFMRFFQWADVNGDPESGFTWTPSTVLSPTTVAGLSPGPLYLRFRVRTNSYIGGGLGHSGGMKWFIFGGPGISGERRMIMWFRAASYAPLGTPLGVDADSTVIEMSAGVSGNRASTIYSNATWTHIQLAWAYTGAVGGPYMRIYVNNNVVGTPTAEHTAFTADAMGGAWSYPEGWDTGHWADWVTTNSYSSHDAELDIMDVEFGTSFNASWAP